MVCLILGLASAYVLLGRLPGGGALPWNRGRRAPAAATGFEEVSALFQGSKHIEFEQRNHSLMDREDETDGAPPLAYDPATDRVTVRARTGGTGPGDTAR
ncbi:DUF6191 domain-containing protein [Nocardia carnea]|uniref:DUF6191 domain-containing protein n=1 Tax=Nocardia carnea TaxID=37328 RepID=UPI0024557B88|nr:DUF6191 domain-containing protein [Nocardia carnea]